MGRRPGLAGVAATALTLAGALLVTQPPSLFPGSSSDSQPPPGGDLTGAGDVVNGHLRAILAGVAAASSRGIGTSGAGVPAHGPAAPDCGSLDPGGVALALVAAAANASGFVSVNLLRGRQHPLALTWWYNLVLALACAAPLAFSWPLPARLPSARGCLLLLAVGSTQLAAQLCLNRGFQLESAGRGAAINVLQVLFSFTLDVAVLGDTPSTLSVAGSALVAAGVLSVALTASTSAAVTAPPSSPGGDPPQFPRSDTAGGDVAAPTGVAVVRVPWFGDCCGPDGQAEVAVAAVAAARKHHRQAGEGSATGSSLSQPLLPSEGEGQDTP